MPRFSRLFPVWCVAVLLLAAAVRTPLAQSTAPAPSAGAPRWFKGNTHTHTVNSDGDSTPDDVVRWYREHGYNFLVLTDHNYLTSVDGLNALHGAADKFLVVRGEEVTSTAQSKAVHVNGLNLDTFVPPPSGATVAAVAQQSVDGVRKANGAPTINHPNFTWAMTPDDLLQVQRTRLFEIFNGHPQVNNEGGGGAPGLEEMWDRLLSSGRLMYGLAVDDAHHFKRPGDPLASLPGRGWVYVRAARLDAAALVAALERGDFYSSTGVELERYETSATAISLAVKATSYSRYRVQFIGRNGRVLAEQTQPAAAYTFRGDEGYVRARVLESNGFTAWTQPVPVGPSGPKLSQ
jgi:hypothetical protein